MNLPDLKQLDRIIALCRKRGVKSIKIDNIELTLGDVDPKPTRKQQGSASLSIDEIVPSDDPTPEAMLFWSTAGDLTPPQSE